MFLIHWPISLLHFNQVSQSQFLQSNGGDLRFSNCGAWTTRLSGKFLLKNFALPKNETENNHQKSRDGGGWGQPP